MKRAPVTLRFLAFLIDLCVLACVSVLLFASGLAGVLIGAGRGRPLPELLPLLQFFVPTLFFFEIVTFLFYFAYLTAGGEKTIGKALFRLKVVARRDGSPLGLARSLARAFGYWLSALPLFLGFWIAFLPGGRAGHDIMAGTAVIKEE